MGFLVEQYHASHGDPSGTYMPVVREGFREVVSEIWEVRLSGWIERKQVGGERKYGAIVFLD